MAAWIPTNFDEACKRNAGRRKLHMRMRKARSDRILRLVASTNPLGATKLRKTKYGLLTRASLAMVVSKATASRDFALVRRIHYISQMSTRELMRAYGRVRRMRDRIPKTFFENFLERI